jgi:hypothetical protein
MLVFINSICIVFITCGVSLIVRVLCFVWAWCYFMSCVICVLCLVVAKLPPDKNPFAVKKKL